MTITTARGTKFSTDKPAYSQICTLISASGNSTILDKLQLTGNTEQVKEVTMLEVRHSFGTTFVSEDFIWQ